MESLIHTFGAIATLAPIIITWVVGIVLALSRWRRHPRVSLFAIIAFFMLISARVVTRFLYIWTPTIMRDRGWSTSELGTIFAVIGAVSALIDTAAWALVICAIFGWRDQRQKENFFPPAPPAYGSGPREQNATPGFLQR